ncbi:hypothetical protein COU74_00740 [Candidatus Peregrinibacteria bacterium CG10_big_fil_rev_8_21_14_0_10_36_19]|nr:MAG: hypothetical protein COU74_00740 [Candidatus Peregrinibacteria bacterium CG10_big_fil_rev_8_21_14_0_10_36_19]
MFKKFAMDDGLNLFSWGKWLRVLAFGLVMTALVVFIYIEVSDSFVSFFFSEARSVILLKAGFLLLIEFVVILLPLATVCKKYFFEKKHVLLLLFALALLIFVVSFRLGNAVWYENAILIGILYLVTIPLYFIASFVASKLSNLIKYLSWFGFFVLIVSLGWQVYAHFSPQLSGIIGYGDGNSIATDGGYLNIIFNRGVSMDEIETSLAKYECVFGDGVTIDLGIGGHDFSCVFDNNGCVFENFIDDFDGYFACVSPHSNNLNVILNELDAMSNVSSVTFAPVLN